MFERVTMNEQGRIVIPAAFRRELGLEPGAKLIISIEDGALRVATPMANLKSLQEMFKPFRPTDGTRASDELIAERRRENAKDEQEIQEMLDRLRARGDRALGA